MEYPWAANEKATNGLNLVFTKFIFLLYKILIIINSLKTFQTVYRIAMEPHSRIAHEESQP